MAAFSVTVKEGLLRQSLAFGSVIFSSQWDFGLFRHTLKGNSMKNAAVTTNKALTIAVIGVGSIGSTFAYRLTRAGHDVTVIARPGSKRLQQLQRDYGIVLKTGEHASLRVADQLDEEAAYDLVLVTTLAHQVDAVLPSLQRSKAYCVHFMFNNFDPERLRDAIGDHRCTFGMPFVMASLDGNGKLSTTINPRQKTLHSDQRWVKLFLGQASDAAAVPHGQSRCRLNKQT